MGALRALGKDSVDVIGLRQQLPHLGADGQKSRDREIGKRRLEGRERSAAIFAQDFLLLLLGERRIDADEIVGFGSGLEALGIGG